jgi:hypothetical protein
MKYIFVDLDNTLIGADSLVGSPPKNSKVITLKSIYFTDRYYARLRPGALELLENLRRTAPTYMLTAAATDYARQWNKEFNLGFKEEDIYAREDSDRSELTICDKFPEKGDVYLIDDKDLPYENTEIKIHFLKGLGKVKIIVIKPYHGHVNQSLGVMQINDILGKIV